MVAVRPGGAAPCACARRVRDELWAVSRPGAPEDFERGAGALGQPSRPTSSATRSPNVPGDHEYRKAMIPVYVRRTLLAAAAGTGPVHHL